MSLESVILQTVEKVAGRMLPVTLTTGTVTAVDKTARTADVAREGLPDLLDVRLNAVTSPTGVLTIYPSVGSHVVCAMVENSPVDAIVISATDIEKIEFNDGANGGMLKVQPVTNEIQSLKDDLNALKTAFTNWVTVPNDGGAALKAATASWAAQQLPAVDDRALQNLQFTH